MAEKSLPSYFLSMLDQIQSDGNNVVELIDSIDNLQLLKQSCSNDRLDHHLVKQMNEAINQSCWTSKIYALTIMIAILKQDQSFAYQEHYKSWLKNIMQLLQGKWSSSTPGLKHLFNLAMAKLLVKMAQLSDIANQFMTYHLSSLIQYIVKLDPTKVQWSSLSLLMTLLQHYSAACGQYVKLLRKFIMACMQHCRDDAWQLACRIWILLSKCGGSGSAGSRHIENWYQLCHQLIATIQSDWADLHQDAQHLKGADMILIQSTSQTQPLKWEPLPVDEPNRTYTLIHQIQTSCACLTLLLQQEFTYPVSVPIATLVKIVSNIININHCNIQTGQHYNIETTLLLSCISKLHSSSIDLLSALIYSSRGHILPYHSVITKIILKVLEITQQQDWPYDCQKPFISLRRSTYQALSDLLLLVSADTLQYVDEFCNHILSDIKPNISTTKLHAPISASHSSHSKKKRKAMQHQYENISSNFRNDNRINPFLNHEICTIALKSLQSIIICLGSSIDSSLFQVMTNFVTQLLIQIQQALSFNATMSNASNTIPVPYCHPSCRLELYHSLLSCVQVSYCNKMPLLLRHAIHILSQGKRDPDVEIIKFCHGGLATCNLLIHTTRPTLPITLEVNGSLSKSQQSNNTSSLNQLDWRLNTNSARNSAAVLDQPMAQVDNQTSVESTNCSVSESNQSLNDNIDLKTNLDDTSTSMDNMAAQSSDLKDQSRMMLPIPPQDNKIEVLPNINLKEGSNVNVGDEMATTSATSEKVKLTQRGVEISTVKKDVDNTRNDTNTAVAEPQRKRVRFDIASNQSDTKENQSQSSILSKEADKEIIQEDNTDDDHMEEMLNSLVDSQPDSDDIDDDSDDD